MYSWSRIIWPWQIIDKITLRYKKPAQRHIFTVYLINGTILVNFFLADLVHEKSMIFTQSIDLIVAIMLSHLEFVLMLLDFYTIYINDGFISIFWHFDNLFCINWATLRLGNRIEIIILTLHYCLQLCIAGSTFLLSFPWNDKC